LSLANNLAEIVRIDRLIRELVTSRKVLTLSDLGEMRRLRDERKNHVRVIQNYKP
jgi:hypothetical protein